MTPSPTPPTICRSPPPLPLSQPTGGPSLSSSSGAASPSLLSSSLSVSPALNGSLSSSSSLNSSSANATVANTSSSTVPYIPRHYVPVIANLSATATASLLFSSPLPTPAVNVTYTMNQSTSVDIPLPSTAILTQLPWHGSLYHVCLQLNETECPITDWSAITDVPTQLQGDGVNYQPPTSLYGLQVNDWVLDFFLYQPSSTTQTTATVVGLPASVPSPQYPVMVSLAVVDVLQAPHCYSHGCQ